jgi:hypothetical protein
MEANVNKPLWRRLLKEMYQSYAQGMMMADPLAFGAYLQFLATVERAKTLNGSASNADFALCGSGGVRLETVAGRRGVDARRSRHV